MVTLRLPSDPESFAGKLYLLVVDKVVIGALLAAAFLLYDRWKTNEVRRYDAARQEVDLSFKRAEYVKELVPVVLDNRQSILFRAHALAALVDTRSITPNSAISLAQKLLLADVLGVGRYSISRTNPVNSEVHTYTLSSDTDDDFLLAALLKMMPSGLPALLDEFNHTTVLLRAAGQEQPSDFEKRRVLNDAAGFWIRLFRETARQRDDRELALLDSDDFLKGHLGVLEAIVPHLDSQESRQWSARRVKGLRIVADLQQVGATAKPSADVTRRLEAIVDPPAPTSAQLDVATETLRLLQKRAVLAPGLPSRALLIVLRREDIAKHRQRPGDERSPTEDRFSAAARYVVWSSAFPGVSRELEPALLSPVKQFHERLQATPVNALDYGTNYPIEWTLVEALIGSNSASNIPPGKDAQAALSALLGMDEERLGRAGLGHLAQQWKEATMRWTQWSGAAGGRTKR